MNNRYEAAGAQSSYEPGSDDQVLANKLAITDPRDMDDAELVLLEKIYQSVLIEHLPDRSLTVQDMKDWHRRWLGNIYPWAGDVRSVNLGKDGFFFAAAPQIPRLLADVMAVQAGRMPLDYSVWEAQKDEYFAAIKQGLNCCYAPMQHWVRLALST